MYFRRLPPAIILDFLALATVSKHPQKGRDATTPSEEVKFSENFRLSHDNFSYLQVD